ncbi:hypothetical protein A21D_01217 [Virgibacillus dokdonensis]|uniref:Uncharacterized protein n=2 Tax=Virgibacillus dokdonensis TaxID=302167 RepID=A0A2K9IX25_9BACI|nr:hypothetical protein A21D_01217 [Virgibacillus dokdonensis]
MLMMLRLPFVRTLIFCVLVLVLLFTNKLTVLNFFVLGSLYSFIESLMSKKELDVEAESKWIDIGWLFNLLTTMILVIIKAPT